MVDCLEKEGTFFQRIMSNVTEKKETQVSLPELGSIDLFTKSAQGAGRETNDARNTAREKILENLLTIPRHFFEHEEHGPAWADLRSKWQEALATVFQIDPSASPACVEITRKGGRGFNYDFLARLGEKTAKIEFKHGGTRITALPEFFNPSADKPLHPASYARFFYTKYLPQVIALYPSMSTSATPPPTEDEYVKTVHQASYAKHPFYTALYNAEQSGTKEAYKKKSAIVKKSIEEFLTTYKDQTDLAYLTAEFRRSQEDKHFLLWDRANSSGSVSKKNPDRDSTVMWEQGRFYHDSLKTEELIADRVIGIRNRNLLVIASKYPGTTFELLLRWKNHIGILYPAWQISMKREKGVIGSPMIS